MGTYRSYDAVKKAQAFLQTGKDRGSYDFPGSLKLPDDSYSGEWDDATMEAFWSWLMSQPEGSDLQTMVTTGIISQAEKAVVNQAIHEYDVVKSGGTIGPAPAKRPVWKYVVGGLAILGTLGLVAWAISRPSRTERTLPAAAGMRWR